MSMLTQFWPVCSIKLDNNPMLELFSNILQSNLSLSSSSEDASCKWRKILA